MKQNYNSLILSNTFKNVKETFCQKSKIKTINLLTLLFTLLGCIDVFGQSPFIDNNPTAPNTFTVPQGVTSITIQLWGGGGAGGGSNNLDANNGGSGGGSGGYTTRTYTGLSGGEIITYTLGAGGTGSLGNGTNGGTSTLTFGGFTLTANGGTGGSENSGPIGTGGTASGGTTDTTGSSGTTGAAAGGAGGNAPAAGGTGGPSIFNNDGNPGNAPGGGGGGAEKLSSGPGASRSRAGGAGGNGGIRITFTCPTYTAGIDQNLATCSTTATLAAATLPIGASGVWTVIAGTAVITTPSSPTSGITAIVPGTPVTLRWTVTNGDCGTSSDDVIISSPSGPGCQVYCPSSGSTFPNGITGVNFNTINNLGTTVNTGYTNFTALSTNVLKGSSYNLAVYVNTGGGFTDYQSVYFDWNGDGDFIDPGEFYNLGTATNVTNGLTSLSPLNITVPVGAVTGATRMRIQTRYSAATTGPCQTGFDGEVEDYTINILVPAACVAPTAQPTALSLTPTGSTIAGGFIAASPVADSYLVVVSTSATPPSAPLNGTTYTIGGTLAPGYTIVDTDSNTSFTATGLTPLTTYYLYIYSFNNLCTGGPFYLGTSPLTGSITTLTVDYCIPSIGAAYQTSTNHHIRKVEFIGTLQDIINTSSYPTVAPFGYENYTGLAVKSIQAKGEGVNIYMESPNSGFIKAWVDWNADGDFGDAGETVYDAGGVSQASTTLGFIIPTGIPAGDYRVRLRISGRNISGSDAGYTWNSCSTNLAYYGETEDYILRVIENCAAKISTVTGGFVCGSGAVTLQATATAGTTEFRWYSAQTGGALLATTPTGTWNTPPIATTTTYWVTAWNGSCETLVRTKIVATVKTVPTLTFATSNTEVCGENSIVALTAGGDTEIIHLIDEHFEAGLGTFTNNHITNNPAVNAQTAWQTHTGPYVPTGLTWYPAIASGFGANNFAFVSSDVGQCGASCYYTVNNALVSSSVNSTGFLNLTLSLRLYFDRYYPNGNNPTAEFMTVDVSVNGGAWTSVSGNTTNDIGYGTRFTDLSYDFTPYINVANLRIRVRYFSDTWANGAAVDDIQLFGTKAMNTAFQWSGASLPDVYLDATATTTPYIAGTPATTVYVKPTLAQLEMGSYTFTATAALSNGCNVSQDITILNKSSIWKGTVNNDWNNAANWSPAIVPTSNSCVIIPNTVTSSTILGTNYNGYGKTLIVKNGGRLDILPSNSLTITDAVTVDGGGIFNIQNTGSLLQINNVANTGIINMERISQPMYLLDYTYWNSPVTAASGFTLGNLTTATSYIFDYLPTQAGANGIWTRQSAGTVMSPTKGYIARAPLSFPTSGVKQTKTVNFIGTPNNGNILMPISKGTNANLNSTIPSGGSTIVTDADDEWNLIGNPYPSAIDIVSFLTNPTNIPVVDGTVYLWTHNNPPTAATPDPFYGNYVLNYTVSDYATVNEFGAVTTAGGTTPSRYIGAGQSFFISADNVMANGTTANVIFNNSMRVSNENNHFLRTENEAQSPQGYEAKRLWLNLSNNAGGFSQALVGYASNATLGWDRGFDAESLAGNAVKFYSLAEDKKLTIQARPWPLTEEDVVPLGFKATSLNNYTIGIDHFDTDFNGQNIYLEDKLLNIIHDLKSAPYSFTSEAGTFDTRFALRYKQSTLSNEEVTAFENTVTIFTNSKLNVKSTIEPIKEITVYDLLGRVLTNVVKVQTNEFTINNLNPTETTLIVKVTLENNVVVTKKVIY